MQEELVHALRAQRPQIRERWTTLLRTERPNSPLANPDSLVHLVDWALDEIVGGLSYAAAPEIPRAVGSGPASRGCDHYPYRVFFLAGEQALLEALVLAQAAQPRFDPVARDAAVSELEAALHQVRNREIEAFCALRPSRCCRT